MFTRQHYKVIARLIRELPLDSDGKLTAQEERKRIAQHFADAFAQDNDRFDTATFIANAVVIDPVG